MWVGSRPKDLAPALVAVAALVGLLGPAAPASAVDADRRFGDRPHVLLAPAEPAIRCLRVRTVPVLEGRTLLYVPCSGEIREPRAPKPWGDRPPLVIPVEGGR